MCYSTVKWRSQGFVFYKTDLVFNIVLKKLTFLGYNQHNFGLPKHKKLVFRI